jgi:hypothetical protein
MESARHFVPSEEHDGHKGAFHEESQNAFDSERGTKDVANEPGIVAPIGTKLEFQDNTRGYTHCEVDAEKLLPELGSVFPETFLRAIVACLSYAHDDGKTEC